MSSDCRKPLECLGDQENEAICDVSCKSWGEFKKKVNGLIFGRNNAHEDREWVFRGVLECHPLKTTLERACKAWCIDLGKLPGIEVEMIREIKRKAFGLGIPLPNNPDCMWWVSLMQHHGAPTRLLDFTYSPYVAAYFAFENLLGDRRAKEAAVWAVHHAFTQAGGKETLSRKELEEVGESTPHALDRLFDATKQKRPSVVQVTSYYLHDRITAQMGVFLCPTDISKSFMDNFKAVRCHDDKNLVKRCHNNKNLVKRFLLPREILSDAVAELRNMNITTQSLFPGFGGLAQSLKLRLPFFRDLAEYRTDQQNSTHRTTTNKQKRRKAGT
jgi:hypothetical protein